MPRGWDAGPVAVAAALALLICLARADQQDAAAISTAEEDLMPWEHLLGGDRHLPLSQDDLQDLRDMLARHMGGGEEGGGAGELRFPALTKDQAKFAVNPGYKEFFEEEFRPSELLGEKDNTGGELESGGEGEEPIHHDNFPKKAVAMARSSHVREAIEQERLDDIYFTTIVGVSSALAVFAIIGAGFCYHRVRRNSKASEDVDYPAYGVTGPGGKDASPTSGADRKLAQNAQLYHYQHQKQQMLAFDSANGGGDRRAGAGAGAGGNGSDCESDEGEEGDYTVYECPGLAPAGEMEVHNPLFQDETTPKASK